MTELKMKGEDLIVSETDENGVITYANDTFCKFAEMELDELVGKPHNIIRHPDMPKWAFEWLWKTINSGQIWSGFVKNLSTKGNFYWVHATTYKTVYPSGEIRYTSVRVAPTREEIEKYGSLYKAYPNKAPEILKSLNLKN